MPVIVPTPGEPQGLTTQQMVDRVRSVLRDEQKNFIDDDEIIDELNTAVLDLAARTRAVRREDSGVFTGSASFDVPTDFLEPMVYRVTPADSTIPPFEPQFVDDTTWYSFVDTAQVLPARSLCRYFTASGQGSGAVETYPTPADGDAWVLRYVAKPELLSLSAPTQVCGLPAVLQTKAVQYARAQLKLKANEMFASGQYMTLYMQDLPQFDPNAAYTLPGPWQLIPEAGPFDTSEAKHI